MEKKEKNELYFALEAAVAGKGKASTAKVLKKVIAHDPEAAKDKKKITAVVSKLVRDTNKLSLQEQKIMLAELMHVHKKQKNAKIL